MTATQLFGVRLAVLIAHCSPLLALAYAGGLMADGLVQRAIRRAGWGN